MHRTLNILDAEQARYRALNAALATAPFPHLEIADQRAQRDRRAAFRVPHIDADARARAIRNAAFSQADGIISDIITGVAGLVVGIGLGAAAFFVGSVL